MLNRSVYRALSLLSISACIDSRGHQIVMGFNTGRVACARYITGRLVGQLDFHTEEITDVADMWNDDSG